MNSWEERSKWGNSGRCKGLEKRDKGLEERAEVRGSESVSGLWRGPAKEGQQDPMSEGHRLDPQVREGLLTGRGATRDLCFNNITLACIFL